jgi:hypothetical protein
MQGNAFASACTITCPSTKTAIADGLVEDLRRVLISVDAVRARHTGAELYQTLTVRRRSRLDSAI